MGNTDSKGLRLRDTGGGVDIESFGVPLYINSSGQSTLINAENGGNVGIGTDSPSDKLHIEGSLRVDGDLKIQGSEPIIIRRYKELGDAVDRRTDYRASTYTAAIIGFRALGGDIKENEAGNIIQVYMYIKNGRWYIFADFLTHNHSENWYVDVMFIRNELVERIDY